MKANAAKMAELVKRINDTKDKDYRFTEFLAQQVIHTITTAQKPTAAGGKAPGIASVMDDVKTLKIAIDAIKSGTDNKFRLLGIDKENSQADAVLPELPIRTLTDNEVEAMRNQQSAEDDVLSADEMRDALESAEDLIEECDPEDSAIIEEDELE